MKILDVSLDFCPIMGFVGKTILFADDVYVSIDKVNNVVDMDGICTLSRSRKAAIEAKLEAEIYC